MKYCVVEGGVIKSIHLGDPGFAQLRGWVPLPEGKGVGDTYLDLTLDQLQKENKMLKAQLQAQVDRSDFIEDCIAEMATVVYGGV